jgi:hypothetical protein
MISKDVFEHLKEDDLRVLMHSARSHVDKMFLVIPLAANDGDGKYSISIVSVAWKLFYTGDTGRQPGSRELSYAPNHTADTGM